MTTSGTNTPFYDGLLHLLHAWYHWHPVKPWPTQVEKFKYHRYAVCYAINLLLGRYHQIYTNQEFLLLPHSHEVNQQSFLVLLPPAMLVVYQLSIQVLTHG